MRFPRPTGKRTSHSYIKSDGSKWFTTAEPGTNMGPGTRWVKDEWHDFRVYKDEDGINVALGDIDKANKKKVERIITWLQAVKKALPK